MNLHVPPSCTTDTGDACWMLMSSFVGGSKPPGPGGPGTGRKGFLRESYSFVFALRPLPKRHSLSLVLVKILEHSLSNYAACLGFKPISNELIQANSVRFSPISRQFQLRIRCPLTANNRLRPNKDGRQRQHENQLTRSRVTSHAAERTPKPCTSSWGNQKTPKPIFHELPKNSRELPKRHLRCWLPCVPSNIRGHRPPGMEQRLSTQVSTVQVVVVVVWGVGRPGDDMKTHAAWKKSVKENLQGGLVVSRWEGLGDYRMVDGLNHGLHRKPSK